MAWVEIPKEYLIADEQIRQVSVPGLVFCLVFYDGRWIAFSRKCPHAGAPLNQGWCKDGAVVCPYHRQEFDLKTGKGAQGQGNFITIYPLQEVADRWYIDVKQGFFQRLFAKL